MSTYLVDSADLTAVANAIRTKGGTSASLAFPAGFISAVEAIETGGGITLDDVMAGNYPWQSVVIGDIAPRSNAFYDTNVKTVRYELTTGTISIGTIYSVQNVFSQSQIVTYVMPFFEGSWASNAHQWFNTCRSLKTVDVRAKNLPRYMFENSSALDTMILRNSAICILDNISAFNGTPFASGGSGGTLYVPQARITEYTQATNWSTILGYANNQILPIEGSIYETQYADGTPIAA